MGLFGIMSDDNFKVDSKSMVSEELVDWRGEMSILERQKYIYNGRYAYDVTLTVGDCEEVVYAHRFILMSGSTVLEDMLIRQNPSQQAVEIHGVKVSAFKDVLRYLYCEEISLTGSNIIDIIEIAKKFKISPLIRKCSKFLQENVDVSNVLKILEQSLSLYDVIVTDKCMEVVSRHARQVIEASDFFQLSRNTLSKILTADDLADVSERELFNAAINWAEDKCRKEGKPTSDEEMRHALGDVVYNIRFAKVSLQDFTQMMRQCKILTAAERAAIYEYITEVSSDAGGEVPPRFSDKQPRPLVSGRPDSLPHDSIRIVCRFVSASPEPWKYADSRPDAVNVVVDQEIEIVGVGLYGGLQACEHTVTVRLYDGVWTLLAGTNTVKMCSDGSDTPVCVMFPTSAIMQPFKTYTLWAEIDGPDSYSGKDALKEVEDGDIEIMFSRSSHDSNCNGAVSRQIPLILFNPIK